MLNLKWFLPALCASGALFAQTMGDLNGLTQAAGHYVSHGMAAGRDTQPLELTRIIGDAGDQATLVTKGVQLTHWTFQYRVVQPGALDASGMEPHRQVRAQCHRGIFDDFQYSAALVTDAKSLEFAWIAVSLDDAITQLGMHGFTQGFSRVTLMRPMNPRMPDEYVYVFDCPSDKAVVGISTQTGALMWSERYN